MSLVVAAAVLTAAGEAFLGALASGGAGKLIKRLGPDPAKRDFKKALAKAITRYAENARLAIARPLVEKGGLLTESAVAEELAKIVQSGREPDWEAIGDRWQQAFEEPLPEITFSEEARNFGRLLTLELLDTESFRPILTAGEIFDINDSVRKSSESLEEVIQKLADLIELLKGGLGRLSQGFALTGSAVRHMIRSDPTFIEDARRGFVGRQWVFDAIDDFCRKSPRGFFFVTGDPGIGKTAISAELVVNRGHVHHFVVRGSGSDSASVFLGNVCAQLVAAYGLDHSTIPPEATEDPGFLTQILGDVAGALDAGERCVVVVDALDEALQQDPPRPNPLRLPSTVPQNIFFIVTMRPDTHALLKPRLLCEQGMLAIAADSRQNLGDIAEYLRRAIVRPSIKDYAASQGLDSSEFVTLMVEKSEGNFMYLRHVLPEISSGTYSEGGSESLPTGLKEYYEDHWHRMSVLDENSWCAFRLPVLKVLAVARKPLSAELIARFSGISERAWVQKALDEWRQFLHDERVVLPGGETQQRYRFYHSSFANFLDSKVGEDELDAVKEQFRAVIDEEIDQILDNRE